MNYAGLDIIFDPNALEATTERLFPVSNNRSARIRKKLIKRFGGEYRKKPCIWQFKGRIIAHPAFRPELERALNRE